MRNSDESTFEVIPPNHPVIVVIFGNDGYFFGVFANTEKAKNYVAEKYKGSRYPYCEFIGTTLNEMFKWIPK